LGSPESRDPNRESPTPTLDSARERSDTGLALSIRGVHLPLPQHPDNLIRPTRARLALTVARAAGRAQAARERAMLLIGDDASQDAGETAKTGPAPADVKQYTVARGDTIEEIARKFKLMPETVMGSNGIFDSEEDLAPGRVLLVPPLDAMYYVAAKGDTLESI